MDAVKMLSTWFLISRAHPIKGIPGFKVNDISTFYIEEKNFKSSPNMIKSINLLSKSKEEFAQFFKEKKKFEIDNDFFKHFSYLFDVPVFKVKDGVFCIMDLAYFFENVCGGLFYKLFEINRTELNDNMQEFKGVYGNLMEKYFAYILKRIFNDNAEITANDEGRPDGFIRFDAEGKTYLLILEFCTKFYRFQSLFNSSLTDFNKDLDDLFFSAVRDGKFIKLNKYIKDVKNEVESSVELIPILVTEKYIGDFDLLNKNDNYLNKKINDLALENLKDHKPIILSLNDLETFWAGTNEGEETKEFISELKSWESLYKGPYFFKFANYTGNPSKGKRMNSKEYLSMFNINKLFKKD